MVVTRKRNDSALSGHDETLNQTSEDPPTVRRSSRLRSTGASPLPLTQLEKTRSKNGESSKEPEEKSDSLVEKPSRGRKTKTSESEPEQSVETKDDLASATPFKRKRTASSSSTKSLDGDVPVRRPSSRNTPLKTIEENVADKSTRKKEQIENSSAVRRTTRRTASEPESDGELLEISTPRRTTRKSLKVSTEPALEVVCEEGKQALGTKPIIEKVELASEAETEDEVPKKIDENSSAVRRTTHRTASEPKSDGELLEVSTPRRTTRKSLKVSTEPALEVVSEEGKQVLDTKPITEEVELASEAEREDEVPKKIDDVNVDTGPVKESVPLETMTVVQLDDTSGAQSTDQKESQTAEVVVENVVPVELAQKSFEKALEAKEADLMDICPAPGIPSKEKTSVEKIAEEDGASGKIPKSLGPVDDFTLVIPDLNKENNDKAIEKLQKIAPVVIPRGKNVSGRFWRDPKEGFKNNFKDKGLKSSKEQYEKLRMEKMRVKLLEEKMKDERKQKIEELRKRQQLKGQRKEINDRKGEVVQVIRNTAKLKTLSKKQKRWIQKRDTTNLIKT